MSKETLYSFNHIKSNRIIGNQYFNRELLKRAYNEDISDISHIKLIDNLFKYNITI